MSSSFAQDEYSVKRWNIRFEMWGYAKKKEGWIPDQVGDNIPSLE
jgi:hypothetical protein